jgi:hypothetical protein
MQNAFIESFNGRLPDELLNEAPLNEANRTATASLGSDKSWGQGR